MGNRRECILRPIGVASAAVHGLGMDAVTVSQMSFAGSHIHGWSYSGGRLLSVLAESANHYARLLRPRSVTRSHERPVVAHR